MYVTPKSPKGGTKRDFAVFASKIQILSNNSAIKFLYVKTSISKVVAISFYYLTVHRWIAGDVLIVSIVRASKKVQLPLIGSRQCAFYRAIDEPCVLPLSPRKGGSNRHFFTFCVAFHIFVAGNRRHFKFGKWVEHSKSQPTGDKPHLKWAWSRYVTHFNNLVPQDIFGTA